MSPYAGIIVGKEFQAHADLVGRNLVGLVHLLMGLAQYAQQVLHVVAHLMGDDVGIGEVAVGTQLPLHGGEEAQVDV